MHERSSRLCVLAVVLATLLPAAPAAAEAQLPVWGSVPSPNRGNQSNALLGIGIVDPTDIWAVGEYNPKSFDSTTRRTLAQHWNGSRWRLVPTPNPSFDGMDFANLESVSGVAGDDVWAVGHGDDFSTLRSRTLIEHWDGTQWRIVPSPNPAGPDLPNRLFGVLARSATDVWAVGSQNSPESALILRFDGARWRAVPNTCGGGLRGITAVPGTETLWAVGENTTCFFDGRGWTRIDPPGFPDLEDVSAVSATDVWAVGFEVSCSPQTCFFGSVIQRWDGTQWRDVRHPLASSLVGVYAAAADDVWAVGTSDDGDTVIQHWNGVSWRDVPSPDPGNGGQLNTIDGLGADELWAAGRLFDDDFDQRTLVVQAPSTTQGQVVGDTNFSDAIVSWFGPVTGSTEADVFGNYDIPGLPAGDYLLTATSPFGGCDPDSAQVSVIAGQTVTQNFRIDC